MLHHKRSSHDHIDEDYEKPNTHVTAIGGEQFTERLNSNSIPHIGGGIRQGRLDQMGPSNEVHE